jgi:hypothetical protein
MSRGERVIYRLIREIPLAEQLPTSAALAELTEAQLLNLTTGGRACQVAIGVAGAWRACCRVISEPMDVMCAGHLVAYRAAVQAAELECWVELERAARDTERAERAARKKAAHRRPRPSFVEHPYTPQPHPDAEWREHLYQIGEPHADLCDLGRARLVRASAPFRVVLDEYPVPSEWEIIPGLVNYQRRGRAARKRI